MWCSVCATARLRLTQPRGSGQSNVLDLCPRGLSLIVNGYAMRAVHHFPQVRADAVANWSGVIARLGRLIILFNSAFGSS
jgi:hypothetical protein